MRFPVRSGTYVQVLHEHEKRPMRFLGSLSLMVVLSLSACAGSSQPSAGVAGLYPALRAANMSPTEALRTR